MPDRLARKKSAGEVAAGSGLVVAATNGPRIFTAADDAAQRVVNDLHAHRMNRVGQAWGLNAAGGAVNEPAFRSTRPGQPGYRAGSAEERSEASAARKRRFQVVQEANRRRNVTARRISRVTGSAPRKVAMATGFLAGVPLAWHGSRELVDKKLSQQDVDAGFASGAAGAGGYQLAMYSTKPVDRYFDQKLKARVQQEAAGKPGASKVTTETIREHERVSGFSGSKPPQGDPRWLRYNRSYPLSLPGARWRRAMSHLHGGKSGVAMTVGMGAAGAAGGVVRSRRDSVSKASEDLVMPSWWYPGIPVSRRYSDPVSPAAMWASSRIMLDNGAALMGRNLSRRERKAAQENVLQFNAARGLVYSPLGMIG